MVWFDSPAFYQVLHPWHWLCYGNNASAVQAIAAGAALVGLILYAKDTREIRKATLAQSDASRRPYFHAETWSDPNREPAFAGKDYFQFKNCGAGIALNVSFRFLGEDATPLLPLGSCAVDRVKYLFSSSGRWIEYGEIEEKGGVYLEYEDTAGMRYWTTITLKPMADDTIHTMVNTGSVSK